ncbi:MAG: hypothetical protein ACI9TH_003053, partial [Kiritimatiellia bacterium]
MLSLVRLLLFESGSEDPHELFGFGNALFLDPG